MAKIRRIRIIVFIAMGEGTGAGDGVAGGGVVTTGGRVTGVVVAGSNVSPLVRVSVA